MRRLVLLLTLAGCAGHGPAQPPFQPHLAPGTPLMLVNLPSRSQSGTLAPDVSTGTVTTWRTVDNVTFAFDRGVLVATRGLGADLMAGEAEPTLTALHAKAPGPYSVQQRRLSGDNHDILLTLTCRMAAPLPDQGQQLYVETCRSPQGDAHENRYWLGRQGQINRSTQWVGVEVGLAQFQAIQP